MSTSSLNTYLKHLRQNDLVVTHRVDAWLLRHPDLCFDDADIALIARLLGPQRSRVGKFTGSQAGSCERRQVFSYMGLPTLRKVDPVLTNLFHDGTWRHIRWQVMLSKAIPGFNPEIKVSAPMSLFEGSLDGVHFDEHWGFELKGTSVMTKFVMDDIPDYIQMQAARYWLATDEDPNYSEITKWVFVFEDKRTQDWREVVVKRNYKLDYKVGRELKRLNYAVTQRELPSILPECIAGKGDTFRGCPYSHFCLKVRSWEEAEDTRTDIRRSNAGTAQQKEKPQLRAKLAWHRSSKS